jgi:uncharacterized membrane protein
VGFAFEKLTTIVRRYVTWKVLAVGFLTIWGVALGLVVWHRFRQFQIFYYDFGIFASALWRFSRFQAPLFDHLKLGQASIIGDHFSISLLLFTPLFWLTSRPEVLLLFQVGAVALSGFVLWRIALFRLKSGFLSFVVLFSYLLFPGLQNAVITDFHPEVPGILFVLLTVYSYFKRNKFYFFVFLLLSLGFKESLGIFFFSFGLYMVFSSRFKNWRWGLATSIAGLSWAWLSVKLMIPLVSGRRYIYFPRMDINPLAWIKNFFFPWVKTKTLLISFSSFLFLPLFSFTVIGILLDFALRFVPSASLFQSWDLGMHYNILLAVFLGIGMIDGLLFLRSRKVPDKVLNSAAVVGIFLLLFINRVVYPTPINLSFNPIFYQFSKNFSGLESFLKKVPPGGTVMSQNNLASRFVDRDFYLLRWKYECYRPKWIVMDVGEGQNPNNFWPITIDRIGKLLNKVKGDSSYKLYDNKNDWFIFERRTFSPRWGDIDLDCLRKSGATARTSVWGGRR